MIVAGSGPRAVVTTASYEARKFGVGSAMPASRARRLCPDAVVIPPDFEAYRATSKAVWAAVRERLDRVQGDGARRGLRGPDRRARSRCACCASSSRRCARRPGVTISVGVGPSRLVAKCCSDHGKPAGLVAMGREEACERFATAPTSRVPGIGPKTAERLAELGLRTIGQLQRADEGQLAARFGSRTAAFLKARAEFRDDSPVETESGPAKSYSSETTFDEDVADLGELESVVRRMAARAVRGAGQARAPRAHDRASRCAWPTGPRSPARARSRRRPTTSSS